MDERAVVLKRRITRLEPIHIARPREALEVVYRGGTMRRLIASDPRAADLLLLGLGPLMAQRMASAAPGSLEEEPRRRPTARTRRAADLFDPERGDGVCWLQAHGRYECGSGL